MAVGAAGEALRACWSSRFTGGVATTRDIRLLLCRRLPVVVQDRADATILREQRVDAEPKQVEVKRLVELALVVTLDFNRDRLDRLAGGESQGAGLGDVV